jgi:recombination protein RecR
VVEESRDIATIESTDVYKGLYHVLGGLLNPMDGVTAETLRVRELLEHVRASSALTEIILALPSTIQGETTSLYLIKRLSEFPVRITRLARGLPVGASLEYADDVTLGSAIQGRQQT